jgi:hypothetical protein
MKQKMKDRKIYRLYSVSFEVPVDDFQIVPMVMYLAIPRTMKMLTTDEIEKAISIAGYGDMPNITGISKLDNLRRCDLPDGGCIIIERNENISDRHSVSESEIPDIGPFMVRMDWQVQ